jgi:hypothetical protein
MSLPRMPGEFLARAFCQGFYGGGYDWPELYLPGMVGLAESLKTGVGAPKVLTRFLAVYISHRYGLPRPSARPSARIWPDTPT